MQSFLFIVCPVLFVAIEILYDLVGQGDYYATFWSAQMGQNGMLIFVLYSIVNSLLTLAFVRPYQDCFMEITRLRQIIKGIKRIFKMTNSIDQTPNGGQYPAVDQSTAVYYNNVVNRVIRNDNQLVRQSR